jgi:hypothetical protein
MRGKRIGAVAAALVALSACGGNGRSPDGSGVPAEEPVDNVVPVVADEYGYSMPAEVKGGVVSLELANEGSEHHEFAFGRLEEGADIEDVIEDLQEGGGGDNSEDLAGVPLLSPGVTMTMVRELKPGTYFFLCAFPDPDFTPHAAKGMYTSFEVTGDAGAEPPQVDATIKATNEGFEVPELSAGEQIIEFRNSGTKEHEFLLLRRAEAGAGTKDFERWIGKGQKGDAPLFFPGGLQTIPPGTSMIQILTLEKGDYLIEDFGNKLEARFSIR